MKDKGMQAAEMISNLTTKLVQVTGSDIGVFICQKVGGVGVFVGAQKGKLGDEMVQFFKLAVDRLQTVIAESEKGKIDLGADSGKFIYKKEEGKFTSFEDEAEEQDNKNQQN